MDRRELHRITRSLEADSRWSATGVEEGTVGQRRSARPSGSALLRQPRGSFMTVAGETVSHPTWYQLTPNGPREVQPIVFKAHSHPVPPPRSRRDRHVAPKRRTEDRPFCQPYPRLLGTLRPPSHARSHRDLNTPRTADCIGYPAPYFAPRHPRCAPRPVPGTITRSLVGRPVIQFRGSTVESERAKRDAEMQRCSPQVVDLVNDDTSSCSDSRSSAHDDSCTPSDPLPSELRRFLARPTTLSSPAELPDACFSSNGLMQMEMEGPRSLELEFPTAEQKPVKEVAPMDLDSLCIAQQIRCNGGVLPPNFGPKLRPFRRLDVVSDVVYDLTQDEELKILQPEPPSLAKNRSGTSAATPRRTTEPTSQSRIFERLQPLLNAIDIVSTQRDDQEMPASPSRSRTRLSRRDLTRRRQNMRSLNAMARELSRKTSTRRRYRGTKRQESSRPSESESSWAASGGSKRLRTEGIALEASPDRDPHSKRSSSQEPPSDDRLWRFLHEGISLPDGPTECPHPQPPPSDPDLAEGICPEHCASASQTMPYPPRDDKIWSDVQSWIEKRTQTQLQQCIEKCTLCGLVQSLLHTAND